MLVKEEVVLSTVTQEGTRVQAIFLPSKGMNMVSLKRGEIEAIDQSTRPLFEERFAGLGALIGPHFHHREVLPVVKNEALFPHIARVKAKGVKEPFSHGIGRYAPWKVTHATQEALSATLKGQDLWNGVSLAELEGQDFKMEYHARIREFGIEIELIVESDKPSVVGLHTYYQIEKGAHVGAEVENREGHRLNWDLENEIDLGFYPYPKREGGEIVLNTLSHKVKIEYSGPPDENSFQVYHPKGASFACVEPLSAKQPRTPKLTASRLKIQISII